MNKKLWFLTKMSLKKKIKTKWFIIANILFMLIIIGLINIDSIIKSFGGDFNDTQTIMVIDEANIYDSFKSSFEQSSKYIDDYINTEIIKYDKTYDEGKKEVEEDKNKILLVISKDYTNYINATTVTKNALGTVTNTILNTSLASIRSSIVLNEYGITSEMYKNINKSVEVNNIVLSDDNKEDGLVVSTIMQIIMLPLFMLIMFLIQMIGAEVNEEKSTRSMEIIISNVSPQTHFIAKIIAANTFVILQSVLLLIFSAVGVGIRLLLSGGNIVGDLDTEINQLVNYIPLTSITSTIGYILPVMILMLLLTFIAYSLMAGILASMTTNLEDFQQLQTPIVVISLIGYYLSMMAGVFKGSLFIKIVSYIPFISAMLSPTLYVLGEINVLDLIGSILLLIGTIYILIKYGLRIYKVGILNYSGTGLWKKMFKVLKEK